jgi:hypothetical protein
LPDRQAKAFLGFVVLMRNDTAERMADIGEFTVTIVKDAVAPPRMLEMWVATDESGGCRAVCPHGQEEINAKARDQAVG